MTAMAFLFCGKVRADVSADPAPKVKVLPELLVNPKKRQVLHLNGYLREYSTLTTYSDTVLLFREKTVDFMVPVRKTGNYRGWLSPRVLASRSYYHFTNSSGLDSVSNHFGQHFSWSDWVGIFKRHEEGVKADQANMDWIPGLFDLFRRKVEFTKFKIKYILSGVDNNSVYADNILCMFFNIESNGRGRNLRYLMNSDGPMYVDTHAELYITDIEYMTVREACRLEKNPPSAEEVGIKAPANAPELHPAICELVERVDNFDYIGHRLIEKADPRYAGKKIPDHFQKRPNAVVRALRSIIRNDVWPKEGMQGKFVLGR